MPHLKYLLYVLRHKWYVFRACLRFDVSLWRAVVHDASKFLPSEWLPYVRHFYGTGGGDTGFNHAWLLHLHRNDHHWQHWILLQDSGVEIALRMPEAAVREMVADWYGAGMAIHGRDDLEEWYEKNKEKLRLHPQTRTDVKELILYGDFLANL